MNTFTCYFFQDYLINYFKALLTLLRCFIIFLKQIGVNKENFVCKFDMMNLGKFLKILFIRINQNGIDKMGLILYVYNI